MEDMDMDITHSTVTKKFVCEMKNFPEDTEYQGKGSYVISPQFNVGGGYFRLTLFDYDGDDDVNEDIYINLDNLSEGKQMVSGTITLPSGEKRSWSKEVLGGIWGRDDSLFCGTMPRKFYGKWAKNNGNDLKLKVSITVHDDHAREAEVPISLRPEAVISNVNRAILEDESTSDFSVKCDTKTFRVHKSFLCARSDVFRAMITGSMKEARDGEVFIEDIDEDSLNTVITFMYTGDLEISSAINVQNLATAAEKYNLAGFMELLCFKLRNMDTIKPGTIADMLLTASRHDNQEISRLRALVLERVRADRDVLLHEEFRKKMNQVDAKIVLDLLKDL